MGMVGEYGPNNALCYDIIGMIYIISPYVSCFIILWNFLDNVRAINHSVTGHNVNM